MHKEIFNTEQIELLPHIKRFKSSYYLVGGTAIALYIGHRRSIDFDLFTISKINKSRLKSALLEIPFEQQPLFEDFDQLHLFINRVKVTFFIFPYQIEHTQKLDSIITLPSLLTLAAMKAFALGRKSKWKDYVDLYFILKNHYTVNQISIEADRIFPQQFSQKSFRQQLAFHKDIDYSETVDYLVEPVAENEIKEFLIRKAIEI